MVLSRTTNPPINLKRPEHNSSSKVEKNVNSQAMIMNAKTPRQSGLFKKHKMNESKVEKAFEFKAKLDSPLSQRGLLNATFTSFNM